MANRKDIIQKANQQQWQQWQQWQQDNKSQTNWKDVITNVDNQQKQSNRKQIINWDNNWQTKTKSENINNIKQSLKDVERNKFWITDSFVDTAKWLFWTVWTLIEYWWTKLTNKNEDWWINDYKKFNEYQNLMWQATNEDEARWYRQKMVDEWVINEWKY